MSKDNDMKYVELLLFMKENTNNEVKEILDSKVYKGLCLMRDRIAVAWGEGRFK